jgi:hypothetical protein
MAPGGRTPEELETLLEDAFVLGDASALARLFVRGGVLAADGGLAEARGRDEIARLWTPDRGYLAGPNQVFQVRDTALILGERAVNVARRGGDGCWRYAIAVLDVNRVPPGAPAGTVPGMRPYTGVLPPPRS